MFLKNPFRLTSFNIITALLFLFPTHSMSQVVQEYELFWDKDQKVLKTKGNFVDGFEDGTWRFWNEDGKLNERSNYYLGAFHDPVEFFHPNGNIKQQGFFKWGVQDSVYTEWAANETLTTKGYFNNDIKDSLWQVFFDSGKPKMTSVYKDSTELVVEFYDKNGVQLLKAAKVLKKNIF